MSYVDIAVIAIIALFALIGLWKGFGASFIKLFCFVLAVGATYFVTRYAIDWLMGIGIIKAVVTSKDNAISLFTLYRNSLPQSILEYDGSAPLTGVLGFFVQPALDSYKAMGGPASYSYSYADFAAAYLSINSFSIIICLLLYGIGRLLASIIGFVLKKIFLHYQPGIVSRLSGFVVGAVRGAAIVCVLLIVSAVVFPFGFASAYTDDIDKSLVAKPASQYVYMGTEFMLYGQDGSAKYIIDAAGITNEPAEQNTDNSSDNPDTPEETPSDTPDETPSNT